MLNQSVVRSIAVMTARLLLGLLVLFPGGAWAGGPRAYITNAFDNTVSVIDTASNTVVATVPVGTTPFGVAVNPAGTFVYVANFDSSTVSVIDTASNTVTATVPVEAGPEGVAVNPAGTFAYVTNSNSSTVSVINTASNTVTATVPVGPVPTGVAVNPAGTFVYVVNSNSDTVSVINTASNTVTATVPVEAEPIGVAVNPAGTFAYVANFASNTVSVIDTASNTVVATVQVGNRPLAFGQFIGGRTFSGGLRVLDPVPDLLSGATVSADTSVLATRGREVEGIAADGVTEIVLRIAATNVRDQFTLTIQDFTSADEVGALGNPGDTTFSASTLNVTAVQTSKGPMAFAIYRAPIDFPRAGGQDAGASSRTVSLQLQPQPNGTATNTKITILRPPVVLIHGLWSYPSTWNRFAPLFSSSGIDQRFFVQTANFSMPVAVTSSNPTYSNSVLRSARANALGFSFNASTVHSQVRNYIQNFKNGQNPAGIQAAAIQGDLVGHSMGGNITRTLPLVANFGSNDTFGQGVIHKAITIGTPHVGSPLAIDFLQNANTCVRNQFAGRGSIAFATATTAAGTVSGAIGDLQGDGTGGGLSAALQSLRQAGPLPIPTALIAAATTANNLNSLNCTFCVAELFRVRCRGNPLADNLTPQGWPTLFNNQPNDAIVPQSSELNLLSGFVVTGFIHTNSLTALDFTGPDELDPSSDIPNQVINLLNTPVTDAQFNPLTP